ncbi:MAG TPA: MotA/TolQ/ExbB proton channel family protein [Anaerohalosphaeraceae bacterium]|nr:MotA/TolQ/ExbB proton channel family protein [Phycisphaerae bacterium]HOK96313.1 MotA/TolQ/ExbB proton channel family protein [Anaerohalosphaeraceae bacterium]HOL31943.1 MotA/TolQ/ExbB proton channel family protein [Anaerohalosphaeraceae bacterium]HOM75893.1 MotA/TolQ/ExbB proton channel family protein [Anaerohalosphaeraceae bacterium]HPC63736.1 MotA/TolQ/ExbB proton channel family protein [Anaerohalosphaeraceae bacterium]
MFWNAEQVVLGQAEPTQSAATLYHQFFTAGGPIVWFILLPMSIFTLYLAIDLLIVIRRSRLLPPAISSDIATYAVRYGIGALSGRLSGQPDLLSRSLLRALERSRQFGGQVESIHQFAAEALQEQGISLLRKAQWCQIIGSVAPMVGLFGTVYGMIRAFNLLGQGGEGPRYELLAEAISIALVTTFWGLLVAIPALFVYGVFQTRIEAFVSEAATELEALLGRIFETSGIFQNELGRQESSAAQTKKMPDKNPSRPSSQQALTAEVQK